MSLLQFVLLVLAVWAALSVAMAGAWVLWRRTGNAGWVDTVWTFALGADGLVGALLPVPGADGFTARQGVVAALVALWALRLGLHIARRSRGIADDPRYAKMAAEWGREAPRRMFRLLELQALVSVPLGVAVVLAAWNPLPGLRAQDVLGLAVLAVAIAGEALADRQLRGFAADPRNRGAVCDVGLWSWSRHPNYFFQWLGWVAYPLLAIDLSGAYPWGWPALAAPLCMYWLLTRVSGIPPLEEHMLETRGDAFRAYQARTNVFFPAPPKRERKTA